MQVNLECQLRLPDAGVLFGNIRQNARVAGKMVRHNSRQGQSVVICGAGPSLADEYPKMPAADEVWACNSALPFLYDHGVEVTHGFTIDQNDAMLADHEFGRALPVSYYLATSVHPRLAELLMEHGREIEWFHSHLGVPNPEGWESPDGRTYERWLYTASKLFTESVEVGHGLNSAVRAVCLALAMGFDRITVIGADCAAKPDAPAMPHRTGTPEYEAWLGQLVLYADGRSGLTYSPDEAFCESVFMGRRWHTRPDMVLSALHLLELAGATGGRIAITGDTMSRAILEASEVAEDKQAFWDAFPKMTARGNLGNWANDVTLVAA